MSLELLLKKRHMVRDFLEKEVEIEKVRKLVYAAKRGPNAGNVQVRKIIVVYDRKYVELLRSVTPSFIANSPHAIVICTDIELAEREMGRQGRDILSLIDSGAAAENVALMAVELGLAVSFVRSSTEEAVKKVLSIPENYRIDIIIGFGYESPNARAPLKGERPLAYMNFYGGETFE